MTMSDPPDNVDRAIALLRRQHYHDVADWLESEVLSDTGENE